MHIKGLIIVAMCMACLLKANAQPPGSEPEADIRSLEFYNAGQWKELLNYGKSAFAAGVDFPLLRMRTGYSAFMLGKYSQSLIQYKKVLEQDAENEVAIYYCYLNNILLNNVSVAGYYAAKLPDGTKEIEKVNGVKITTIETEYSYKRPTISTRGDAQYARAGISSRLGSRTQLHFSTAFYKQIISEPELSSVTDNRNIDIQQHELYSKIEVAASGKWSLVGAYHYLYTPFNNFIYHNHIGYAAVKFHTPYINLQAAANLGRIGDSALTQLDGTFSIYPFGNLNMYLISRLSHGNTFTFSQVAGIKIFKGAWLEGNVVAGTYRKLLEKDALYVYNDIDTKKLKAGTSIYISVSKKLNVSASYTFERKLKIFTNNLFFNQHSINGGLSWNF